MRNISLQPWLMFYTAIPYRSDVILGKWNWAFGDKISTLVETFYCQYQLGADQSLWIYCKSNPMHLSLNSSYSL